MRDASEADLNSIDLALLMLRKARDHLREADAKRSADYVRRAIKSAEGAKRHAQRAAFRAGVDE